MFCVNDKVVYPGHGVAVVSRIIDKSFAGFEKRFYELQFLHKDMTILIPLDGINSAGVRPLSEETVINTMFCVLAEPARKDKCELMSWSKRNKQYQAKIQSGDIVELSKIYRDLSVISTSKQLSYSEKNLLQHVEDLLIQELAQARNMMADEVLNELRDFILKTHPCCDSL